MDNQTSNFDIKKIILIIAGLLVLTLGLVVWLFIARQPSTNNQNTNEPVSNVTPLERSVDSRQTPIPQAATSMEKYSNQYFTIDYPKDFTLTDGVFGQGGTLTTFAKGDTKVVIQTTVDPKVKAKEIIDRYVNLRYATEPFVIGNISGTVVAGSIPDTISEKGYIFDFNGRTYRVVLIYNLSQRDLEKEKIVDEMMRTFRVAP